MAAGSSKTRGSWRPEMRAKRHTKWPGRICTAKATAGGFDCASGGLETEAPRRSCFTLREAASGRKPTTIVFAFVTSAAPGSKWLAGGYIEVGAVNLLNRLPQYSYYFHGYDTAEADIRGRFLYAQIGTKF